MSTVVHRFSHPFDEDAQATRYAINHGKTKEYWLDEWKYKSLKATTTGTLVHEFGESLGCVQMFIYEAALERFDEEDQRKFFEMALSVLSFDSEKCKLLVDSTPNAAVINMCRKYGNDFIEKVELQNIVIQKIEEEEKEAKAAAKEAKANKK